MDETKVYFGDALKALDEKGKVGGYLVRFGTAKRKDLDGEYFTDETYYGPNDGNGSDTIFHHAKSLPVESTQLTVAVKSQLDKLKDHLFDPGTVKRDAIGLFAEVVLNMADEYEAMVYDLVTKNKLGWSSGAVGHMVKVASDGKIVRWPIGEKSFTPRPAEPQNRAIPIKSFASLKFVDFKEDAPGKSLKGMLAMEMAEDIPSYYQVHCAMCELVCDIAEAASANQEILATPIIIPQKVDELWNEFTAMAKPIINQQIQDYVDGDMEWDFYLKALASDAPFDLTVSAATKFIKAMERNHLNRTKEGRMLSTANRKKLMGFHDSIMGAAQGAKDLLDASEPKPKSADPNKLRSLRLTLLRG